MAKWHSAQLIVHLKTDLHCGTSPLGFISRTLTYVPSHIPFYALVLSIAKKINLPAGRISSLENFLSSHIRFTPFFVFYNDQYLFPWERESLIELEKRFLYSFYGVALDYNTRGAMENRLFEKEVVLAVPVNSKDGVKRTQLKGYIFWKEGEESSLNLRVMSDCAINNVPIEEFIVKSQWGGEINKGLGCLKDVQRIETQKIFSGELLNNNSIHPTIRWPANKKSPFYLQYVEEIEVEGRLMPLTGRRYDIKRGPGVKMEDVVFVWDIGWRMKKDVDIGIDIRCVKLVTDI